MLQVSVILFWLALGLYAGATVLYGYHFLSRRESYSRAATFLTGAGFLLHTASIGLRSVAENGTRLEGPNTLVLAAWALVFTYFVVEHLIKLKLYGTALVPVSVVLMVAALLMRGGDTGGAALSPLVEDWKIGIHVALIFFANAGFAIGGAVSATYLIQAVQLKRHKTSLFFKRLPALGQIDTIARRVIAWSFPFYSAGLLLGTLRAVETDVGGWWADPRVMLAGVVWAIFGAYLVLHYRGRMSARNAAYLALVGFAAVALLSVLARTVPAGFHVFGV